MFPGVNPRQMRAAMQKMGVAQEELPVELVVMYTKDKELVIKDPSVVKIKMMGQESFQVSGVVEERPRQRFSINEDDVKVVMEQAGVTAEDARRALESSEGDIAQAILSLQEGAEE